MTTDLKPCPFCGNKPYFNYERAIVFCENQKCEIRMSREGWDYASKRGCRDAVVRAWNKRTQQ